MSDLTFSTGFAVGANKLLDTAYLSSITENAAWRGVARAISVSAAVSF